jgi:hypothetical protein
MDKRKELKKNYQQAHRPMGVFQIRNTVNNKVLVGVGLDLPGILNRHRFQLNLGSHRNKVLQAEWHEFGSDQFSFDILDELTPTEGARQNYQEELAVLEALWLDKLQPYGERGYNGETKK